MKKHKLIIVDGIPGSGKSTLAENISKELNNLHVNNRFYHELEENHPLFIYERKFNSFTDHKEATYFFDRVIELFTNFVHTHVNRNEIVIVESVLFQDTLSYAFNMKMEAKKIQALFEKIKDILTDLNPLLIYFYQMDVKENWRFISEVRGAEWIPSLRTEEGLKQAEKDWKPNQGFMRSLIDDWNIPKLIIENKEYLWEQYTQRSIDFVREYAGMSDNII